MDFASQHDGIVVGGGKLIINLWMKDRPATRLARRIQNFPASRGLFKLFDDLPIGRGARARRTGKYFTDMEGRVDDFHPPDMTQVSMSQPEMRQSINPLRA